MTLQQMEAQTMRRVLGENGVTIWKKANGIDKSLVMPFREQKSMSKEHTYEADTIDMKILRQRLATMVDELAFDLRKEGKICSCLTLKIRYSNFDTHTKQMKIPYTSSEKFLTERTMELFDKLYSRRMLIRLIGVKFSGLVAGNYQTDLFSDNIKDLNLLKAMDEIRHRYGVKSLLRGSCF
jgi:DNA polymerase-4